MMTLRLSSSFIKLIFIFAVIDWCCRVFLFLTWSVCQSVDIALVSIICTIWCLSRLYCNDITSEFISFVTENWLEFDVWILLKISSSVEDHEKGEGEATTMHQQHHGRLGELFACILLYTLLALWYVIEC